MSAYYNEIDPHAAQGLRNLIDAGHIVPGIVDQRSIEDVHPADLHGFTQCHFFAGIGVWSLALRKAGWSDDRPVWTGSCPCQPFSAAGKGEKFTDERHLWPAFNHLIGQCRPELVFGEQVASKDGLEWLDLVHTDMEGAGYAFGAADTCAAGFGAPNIRQRLYWVADAQRTGIRPHGRIEYAGEARSLQRADGKRERVWPDSGECGAVCGMVNPSGKRLAQRISYAGVFGEEAGRDQGQATERTSIHAGGLADTDDARPQGRLVGWHGTGERAARAGGMELQKQPGPTNGLWRAADWLLCRDGKWRPVEPYTFPLVASLPARVGSMSPRLSRLAEMAGLDKDSLKRAKDWRKSGLKGYGNAINAEAARVFVECVMESI